MISGAVKFFLMLNALIWTVYLAMLVAGSNSADLRTAAAFSVVTPIISFIFAWFTEGMM